jgi:hypothetical protein
MSSPLLRLCSSATTFFSKGCHLHKRTLHRGVISINNILVVSVILGIVVARVNRNNNLSCMVYAAHKCKIWIMDIFFSVMAVEFL